MNDYKSYARMIFSWFLNGAILVVHVLLDWPFTSSLLSFGNGFWNVLMSIIFITFCGYCSSNFFVGVLISYIERVIVKIPIVNVFYRLLKDLTVALVDKKIHFNKPVVVSINGTNGIVKKIGFVTSSDLETIKMTGYVSVFVPQCFSFSGELLIVRKDRIVLLDNVSSDFVIKFVMSAGILSGIDTDK